MPRTEPSTTSIRSVELAYTDTGGSGRPIVLIHGWPLDHTSWSANIPALTAAGFRVIAYDRRGFGDSDKPLTGYDYDQLSDDLASLLNQLDLRGVTLVGFSMGGGEVARYVARHGQDRVHSVVFASAVTPYLLHGDDNPDGPLSKSAAAKMTAGLTMSKDSFFDGFLSTFFSADGVMVVTEAQRQDALAAAEKASKAAALETMAAFGFTDFREDLTALSVPALIIHGDSDATVPFEGSGARTHQALPNSELYVVEGGPHGVNVSHADEFDQVLVQFLRR